MPIKAPIMDCYEIRNRVVLTFGEDRGLGSMVAVLMLIFSRDNTFGLLVIEGRLEKERKCEHLAREAQTPRMCYFRLLSRGRTCRSVLL